MFNDKEFLEKKDFVSCCMKLTNPKGGWPVAFGVIFPDEITTIYVRDHEGNLSETVQQYNSVDEILEAGWIVD
jgi:hypothetical protein